MAIRRRRSAARSSDARDDKNVTKAKAIWDDGMLKLHRVVADSTLGYRLHAAYKLTTWLRGLIPDTACVN